MPTVYSDSSYCATIYVSGQKPALSADRLATFASFTNGGTIPFYIRWQYSWKYIETSKNVYGGWGPLDETVDKINGTPGLRLILNLAYAPSWWLALDATGKNVGYGNGILPDGPAMATFAAAVTTRYTSYINSGRFILQIGNEEYDTNLNGAIGGTIQAQAFNYAVPAITAIAPNALIIAGCVRRLAPGGSHVLNWMTNFFTYVPKAGEPGTALPYAMDFHYYRDGSSVVSSGNVAPDPTTTDNSQTPASATTPSVAGEIAIIQGVLNTYSPGTQIWNLENGFGLPNNSTGNKNSSASELPSQQSRYTRNMAAQMHYALGSNGKYAFYTLHSSGNDPKSMCGTAISDYTTYIAANPQWTGAAPTAYLYQSVDALSFEGTTGQAPIDQYFSIMNPTGSSQSWSISSNQAWLTAKTLPINGMKGTTGANLTSGTLSAGQCITLKCTADSTTSGLTQLTALTGTLTVTIGGNVSTITVSLFVTPTAANPNITSASAGPGNGPTFNMTVNASPPANQTITFKNQDAYATWWYAFATCNWFTLNTSSGSVAAGATQNITISIASVASSLAPGTYTESLTISATPFPPTYTTDAPPPTTQFITVIVKLVVGKSSTSAVQLSTSTFNFAAVASGALPASQTFYLLNCRNATDNWTVAKTQSWLTLSPTSGSNLPANGSSTGTTPNIQHTDYKVITASINSTALAAGTYTDTITVTLGSTNATIAVSYVVSSTGSTMTIGASPGTLTLSQVQGGTAVSGTTTLTNSGNTTGTYHHTTTYTHGTGFISMSPGSGTLTGSGGTQIVTITCTPGSLVPDTYTGFVTFNLGTTSAVVNVSFTVSASGSAAALSVSPVSLVFNDVVGEALTTPQSVTLSNTGALSGTWAASISYTTGNNWIVLAPTTDTLAAGASEAVTVTMNDISLAIGTYTATITFSAGSSTATVTVTLIINAITVSSSAQMTQSDMAAQYAYILSTVVGQQLSILANIYYGGATNNQVIYGELDALFPFETMSSQLHVMKSINDVTAFLNAYAYVAQVLSDSPIVYYRLGESSGIYAYDISGRNMTGTISTNNGVIAGVTQGQVGALTNSPDTAYLFDGSTGNILLPAGVNTANWSALSVEAWIKLSNITFSQTAFIIANDAPLTTNLGFNLAVTKNSVVFRIGKGSAYYEINQAYTFAANTWYHLVGVFAGTSLTAYINGNQIATTSVASAVVAQTTNVVNIASKPGVTTNNFPGTLDEISLYNTALSAARVQVHYLGRLSGTSQTSYATLIVADNPVAYYRMNETSGLIAYDSTSNHFDATLSGSSLTYSVAGIVAGDTAIGFGAYDSLIFPSTLVLANYAGYSLEYWINVTQGWQHIVITVDSTGNTLYYLNGASYSSGSGDSVVVDIDVYYTGSFSAGSLDEIAVYSYVLSAAQVANHFAVGSLGV